MCAAMQVQGCVKLCRCRGCSYADTGGRGCSYADAGGVAMQMQGV